MGGCEKCSIGWSILWCGPLWRRLRVGGNGGWQLVRDSGAGSKRVLASGLAGEISPGTWHALALGLHGTKIIARIDGRVVARVTDRVYRSGPAGIESNWTRVEFRGLTVQ